MYTVDLECPWDDVSSGSSYAAILHKYPKGKKNFPKVKDYSVNGPIIIYTEFWTSYLNDGELGKAKNEPSSKEVHRVG